MPFPITNAQVRIANATALSAAFFVGAGDIQAVQVPSSWTTANLTFQGAASETGTYEDLYDDAGNEIVVVAAAGKMSSVGGGSSTTSLPWMKVRSGTGGTPVSQGADRVLSVVIRRRMFGGRGI